jgi:hypothetical protein
MPSELQLPIQSWTPPWLHVLEFQDGAEAECSANVNRGKHVGPMQH